MTDQEFERHSKLDEIRKFVDTPVIGITRIYFTKDMDMFADIDLRQEKRSEREDDITYKYHFGFKTIEEAESFLKKEFRKDFGKKVVYYEVFYDTSDFVLMKNNIWLKRVCDESFKTVKFVFKCPVKIDSILCYQNNVHGTLKDCLEKINLLLPKKCKTLKAFDFSNRIQLKTQRYSITPQSSKSVIIRMERVDFIQCEEDQNTTYYVFHVCGTEDGVKEYRGNKLKNNSKIVEYLSRCSQMKGFVEDLSISKLYTVVNSWRRHFDDKCCNFVPVSADELPRSTGNWMTNRLDMSASVEKMKLKMKKLGFKLVKLEKKN